MTTTTTTFLARAFDTPRDPFQHPDALRAEEVAIVVTDGVITQRRPATEVVAGQDHDVVDLRDGVLLPGLVDAHVHYPQVRAIGGLGMPLLDWLERCALPEEARLADHAYAASVAGEFLAGLVAAGTTTALVFGSHFAGAVDTLCEQATVTGLRLTVGQVVGDRNLLPELHTDPDTARAEGLALIDRWHGVGRLRYAVTPRFSLATSEAMLEACRDLLHGRDDLLFTSHVNENLREVAAVAGLFPGSRDYVDTYDRHGLLGRRSVLAHNVHPSDAELTVLAERGTSVAHCPTSNAALGSGLFPLRRHVEAGVRVALGSDVGAGTGFCLLKEGLQAYFGQRLQGDQGQPLTSAHLLHLATSAGAHALGLADQVGDLSVGKQFDALWLRPSEGSTLATALQHACDEADALAKVFVLGTPGDVAGVWVGGGAVTSPSVPSSPA